MGFLPFVKRTIGPRGCGNGECIIACMNKSRKIKRSLAAIIGVLLSTPAFAVEMNAQSCWKAFNGRDQAANFAICQKQVQDLEYCSENMWETKQAAFDVCLMKAASNPTKILQTFKGYSQSDQNAGINACLPQQGDGKICVSNAWIHGQGAFDVCLME